MSKRRHPQRKRDGVTVPEHWQTQGEVIPTYMLKPYLDEAIDHFSREADLSLEGNKPIGGLRILAEQAAGFYDRASANSLMRRIYMVREEEQVSASVILADALLLAMGKYIENEPLPVLPGCVLSAREMVREYHLAKGEKITLPEAEKLARKMLNITKGLLYTEELSTAAAEAA